METLTLVLSVVLGFCVAFYLLTRHCLYWSRTKRLDERSKRILLVTSHPDDETMFFGPTVISLCRDPRKTVFLLCLSNGQYRGAPGEGQGPLEPLAGRGRKGELYEACKVLGVPQQNVVVLSYTRLKDDPNVRWREEVVSEVVLQTMHSYDIDTVLTFDRYGVSGHRNHCSVYSALAYLVMERRLPGPDCRVYTLRTVNLLRKYSSVLDVPASFLMASVAYTASLGEWRLLLRAMRAHSSQFVWFRKLYMLFSRYTLINTFDEIKPHPHQGPQGGSGGGGARAGQVAGADDIRQQLGNHRPHGFAVRKIGPSIRCPTKTSVQDKEKILAPST